MNITTLQQAIKDLDFDGWLFYDHHRRDPLAYRILSLSLEQIPTRRWYYFVPRSGEPQKLVHQIESAILDSLPGRAHTYSSWKEHDHKLATMLQRSKRVAMQYSARCSIPTISLADAGTVETVRAMDVDVVSSANLIQRFEGIWTASQLELHLEAGRRVDAIRHAAFQEIFQAVRANRVIDEFSIKTFILTNFAREGLFTDHGPIVAVDRNTSNPHYEPSSICSSKISPDSVVLIDLWAKLAVPKAVYYDITWTGYCGVAAPSDIQNVFRVVTEARNKACEKVMEATAAGSSIRGCDIDDVARDYISAEGFGDLFFHRTGHSIGEDVHGAGANIDNFETHDDRIILSSTCFSIEPGVYLPHFGIRSEVDVFVGTNQAQVTGEIQNSLLLLN